MFSLKEQREYEKSIHSRTQQLAMESTNKSRPKTQTKSCLRTQKQKPFLILGSSKRTERQQQSLVENIINKVIYFNFMQLIFSNETATLFCSVYYYLNWMLHIFALFGDFVAYLYAYFCHIKLHIIWPLVMTNVMNARGAALGRDIYH